MIETRNHTLNRLSKHALEIDQRSSLLVTKTCFSSSVSLLKVTMRALELQRVQTSNVVVQSLSNIGNRLLTSCPLLR